jgi:hypothetical protein
MQSVRSLDFLCQKFASKRFAKDRARERASL